MVERALMKERLRALDEELVAIMESALDANGDDEHDPEGATVAFERQRTAALRAHEELRLGEVERALDALDEGNYGVCSHCGKPIAAERLVALPGTGLCLTCAGPPSGLSGPGR